MFRMSTRKKVMAGLPGVTMSAWRRKRNVTPFGPPDLRQTGQKQEEGCGKASEDSQIAKGRSGAIGVAGPGVERVRLDHHKDGQPSRPVDVGPSHGPILQG